MQKRKRSEIPLLETIENAIKRIKKHPGYGHESPAPVAIVHAVNGLEAAVYRQKAADLEGEQ